MRIDTQSFGPLAAFGAGAIYVPCAFDSRAQECQIDTGSDTSSVQDDSFFDAYPSVGKSTGAGLSGQPFTCDVIEVSRFELGGSPSGQRRFERCSPGQAQGGVVVGTMAGLDSLSAQALHFDFKNGSFSATDPIPPALPSQPFTVHSELGHFGFQVAISGVNADSIIDTGAALTVVDNRFIESHGDAFRLIQAIPGGTDADGKPIVLNLYQMAHLAFGGDVIDNAYVLGADFTFIEKFLPGVPIILGFNVIHQRNWYFDLSQMTWAAD